MERNKWYTKVYGIAFNCRLDCVGVEDGVLKAGSVNVSDIAEGLESVSRWQAPCIIVRHDVRSRHAGGAQTPRLDYPALVPL